MTEDERIQRMQRWQSFYTEPGGLGEMLGRLTADHMKEAVQSEPWETDRLKKVALSLKIISELDQVIRSIVSDGVIAERSQAFAAKIAELPERKRRWL